MEFEGKIRNVMPARTGTSQRGNEWKSLPFVFEYKEVETDPYPDSVLLETFDTNIINGIESCCQKDAQGQLIVNNGELILNRDIYVRIGFRHKARVYAPEGKPARFINDIRINSIQAIKPPQHGPAFGQQPAPTPSPAPQPQAQNPFPPQTQEGGADDLPF